MVNLISGGLHAGGNLDFQDFLLLPIGARTYSEALEMTVAVYRALGGVLTRHGFEGVLVGDEGGFGPRLRSNEQAVEMVLEAIAAPAWRRAGTRPSPWTWPARISTATAAIICASKAERH